MCSPAAMGKSIKPPGGAAIVGAEWQIAQANPTQFTPMEVTYL